MKSKVNIAVTVLALGIFAAPSSLLGDAAIKLKLRDDATWTSVSGYSAAYKTLGASGGFRGTYKIRWWEDGDKPCKLELSTRHLNTFDTNLPYMVLDGIGVQLGKKPCSSPGNVKSVQLTGNSNWIYKLQVCTTDKASTSKNKLKGLRIWARTVNDRDPLSLSTQGSTEETVHTNCNKWHSAVACPSGKVASRLRVHYDASEEFIRGIALECRTLELK